MDQKINIHIYSYDDGTVSIDLSVPGNVKVNRIPRYCDYAESLHEEAVASAEDEEDEGLLYDELC